MKREYDFSRRKRGPILRVPRGKTRITIRLDQDILNWFEDIRRVQEPLEATFSRVVRVELNHAKQA